MQCVEERKIRELPGVKLFCESKVVWSFLVADKMVMEDGLETSIPPTTAIPKINLLSFDTYCKEDDQLGDKETSGITQEDSLNTPVTTASDPPSFFGSTAVEPPLITGK